MTKAVINLENLTIDQASRSLRAGDYTSFELTKAYLKRIKEFNPDLNCYLEVFEKSALKQAEYADSLIKKKSAHLLCGLPIAIKDNLLIKGQISSSGSKFLSNYKAPYSSPLLEQLQALGVVFLGRVNMSELSASNSIEDSAFGSTKNPQQLDKFTDASLAVLVADLALMTIGSDLSGELRQIAGFDLVSLKPTNGIFSTKGLTDASSFSQIGFINKTSLDSSLIFQSLIQPNSKYSKKNNPSDDLVIGIPNLKSIKELSEEDQLDFQKSLEKIIKAGFEIKEIELPNFKEILSAHHLLVSAELATGLARLDGFRYGQLASADNLLEQYVETRGQFLGEIVRQRIIFGYLILSTDYYNSHYQAALNYRQKIRGDYQKIFLEQGLDSLLTPLSFLKKDSPLNYLKDFFTVSANLLQWPSLALSLSEEENDYSSKVLFLAPPFQEESLLKISQILKNKND